jgi:hypothetical protein
MPDQPQLNSSRSSTGKRAMWADLDNSQRWQLIGFAAVKVAIGIGFITFVGALALPFVRERLRVHYDLKVAAYYNALPAGTNANRQEVVNLLKDWSAEKTPMATPSSVGTPPGHGRTDYARIVTDGEPYEPRLHLSTYSSIRQWECHHNWGWGDGWLDLCSEVDESTAALIHYEDDVENYWVSRLQPIRLPAFGVPHPMRH